MTTRALTIPIVELKPNSLPYGEMRLCRGVWDQLQARKAYEHGETPQDDYRTPAIDRQV